MCNRSGPYLTECRGLFQESSQTMGQFHMWLPLLHLSSLFEVALRKTDMFERFVAAPQRCGLRNTGRINKSANV